ncbi:MAG: FAD-dependent oxidoreductase [Candidatus Vogelbacteria bacterium]|nr:FAD-dependent oxidoreductase [Candidatus Vogelbacteria bacterium]
MDNTKEFDVLVVGGGVVGSALCHFLERYTNIPSIGLIEKGKELGEVNSSPDSNSQTVHFGDIETNYGLEKAKKVKEAGDMIVSYLDRYDSDSRLHRKTYKLLLGVGDDEVALLEKRYEDFKATYPKLKKLYRDEIAKLEPNIVKNRDPNEKIIALYSDDGYAVDYKKLADSFVGNFLNSNKRTELFLETKVSKIYKKNDLTIAETNNGTFAARVVVVTSGPYSLYFAHKMDIGKDLAILPVAGSFYKSKNLLNGKVYTVQIDGIPFAAIHGDPNVNDPTETRFGPTAKMLPLFERHRYNTFFDFITSAIVSVKGIFACLKIILQMHFFWFAIENILYDFPIIGKLLFMKNIRKIVPSANLGDVSYGKNLGGVRPQVVDLNTGKIFLGEIKLFGENIIFNVTPSPGATNCLKNASGDVVKVVEMLGEGFTFNKELFEKEFKS